MGLAACGETPEFETRNQANNDGKKFYRVPPFKLLECQGRPIGNAELAGNVWVASFIFTTCPTHCIAMVGEMEKLQEEFAKERDFKIVATTVDPATDSPEALKKFAKERMANPEQWYFLWGQRALVKKFAHDGLKISWRPEEPLIHSTYFVLVGKNGFVRGMFDNKDARRMADMRKTIRKLLAES